MASIFGSGYRLSDTGLVSCFLSPLIFATMAMDEPSETTNILTVISSFRIDLIHGVFSKKSNNNYHFGEEYTNWLSNTKYSALDTHIQVTLNGLR